MAEGNGDDNSSDNFRNASGTQSTKEEDCEENSVSDLVSNIDQNLERNAPTNSYNSYAGPSEIPRKEENPFSFKHFLRSDSSNFYSSQGARPKVYCDGRPVSSISDVELRPSAEHKTRIIPEFSSALPDFVQDHLVIEQCYLGNDSPSQSISVDLNNLPDFTPNRNTTNRWNDSSHSNERRRSNNPPPDIPLDLPIRPQPEFPLDLPAVGSSRSCPPSSEVGVSKSLPDFLADGAVRTTQSNDNAPSGQSPERETDRLRQELELCRRQLFEQCRRSERLERDLAIAHEKEQEYTQNLAKALEQVEETLSRSNRRGELASKTISKLQQEVKTLTAEIVQLQRVNRNLRSDDGASGGPSSSNIPNNEVQSMRLAQELRIAASTAEHSLRQLLTGVDNLRFMAASLESMHRAEEKTDPFLSDLDEDTGPAL